MTSAPPTGDRLLFRRQYVLGPRPVERPGWPVTRVADDLWLTAHPDLGVTRSEREGVSLFLLGYALDPYHPEADDQQVLDALAGRSRSWDDLLRAIEPLSGRFVLLRVEGSSVMACTDAMSSRQIHYARVDGAVWCAAQPALLAAVLGLPEDPDPLVQDFIRSDVFQQNQRFWPGDGTAVAGVRHLLANHQLDVRAGVASRFWPYQPLEPLSWQAAVPLASENMTGTLKAAARRAPLVIAVTAGMDTRTVVAASRAVAAQAHYFVQRLRSAAYPVSMDVSPDIVVPTRLMKKLGYALDIIDSTGEADPEFARAIQNNVTLSRPATPANLEPMRRFEGCIRMGGIGAETARDKYYEPLRRREPTARFMAELEHGGHPYAEAAFARWLADMDRVEACGVHKLDLWRWEQKFGKWAAIGSAEADILCEELSAFSNRRLLATLLAVDIRHRTGLKYTLHKAWIRNMWPEVLGEPINPKPLKTRLKYALKAAGRRVLGNTELWARLRALNNRSRVRSYVEREPGGGARG